MNAPLFATTVCAEVSLFVHVTLEPTEMFIRLGVNPPLTIVTFMVVGVGDVGELLFPHAIAAVNRITAKVILIGVDIFSSFRNGRDCKRTA